MRTRAYLIDRERYLMQKIDRLIELNKSLRKQNVDLRVNYKYRKG